MSGYDWYLSDQNQGCSDIMSEQLLDLIGSTVFLHVLYCITFQMFGDHCASD